MCLRGYLQASYQPQEKERVTIKKTSDNRNTIIAIFIGIDVLLIATLIFRAFLCINTTDEVFNIEQAFRFIQGNKFLVENWDYYQTGDSFLSPFLHLFYMINGSTEGIVLFSRIIFLLFQFSLALFCYKILSSKFDHVAVFMVTAVYFSAISLKQYCMWYDNWELFFRTVGLFLIAHVFMNHDKISTKTVYALLFIAGISHACMVYAYPTMICVYVAVLLLVLLYKRKSTGFSNTKAGLFYIAGSTVVFSIFAVYVLKVGIGNLFIFNNSVSQGGLESTGRGDMFVLQGVLLRIKLFFAENFNNYKCALLGFAVDILVFILAKYVKFFISLMVIGCVINILESNFWTDSLSNALTYLIIYTPFFFALKEKNEMREIIKVLLLTVFLPSLISGIMYSYTALNGAVKFASGARLASFVVLLIAFEVIKESSPGSFKTVFGILTTSLVFISAFAMFHSAFQGTKPYKCNTRIDSGIYKGIIDSDITALQYTLAENGIRSTCIPEDKTVACGPFALPCYLMSDLKPDTYILWEPVNLESSKAYYSACYGEPDVFILNENANDCISNDYLEWIEDNYNSVNTEGGFVFYRHK